MPESPARRLSRFRFRLSVRALMLIVLIVGGGLGWYIGSVRRQAEAVEFLRREVGGSVQYDWEYRDGVATPWPAKSPWPEWMMKRLGPDFLSSVTSVTFQKRPSSYPDEVLRRLRALPRLERVCFNLHFTSEVANDADLALICQLDRLKSLEIGYNKITNEGLSALKNLGQLEELNAEFLLPDRSGFAHLAALKSLEKLQINSTDLDDNGLAPLEALTNLRELDLINDHDYDYFQKRGVGNDGITSAGLVHLSQLRCLERLSLCNNRITHLDPLRDLKSLRELRLKQTDANDQALAVIGGFSNLEILCLGSTKVTDAGTFHLSKLSKLRMLRLAGTEIGDPTIVHLSQLKKLEKLDLQVSGITGAKLEFLAHCQVIRLPRFGSREVRKSLSLRLPGVIIEYYNTGIQELF